MSSDTTSSSPADFQAEPAIADNAKSQWDENDIETRTEMGPVLGAVKTSLVHKTVGAKSLSGNSGLQLYCRNVHDALHNPPMDDMVIIGLAKASIDRINE